MRQIRIGQIILVNDEINADALTAPDSLGYVAACTFAWCLTITEGEKLSNAYKR